MNKYLYRSVFNPKTGVQTAVAEMVSSRHQHVCAGLHVAGSNIVSTSGTTLAATDNIHLATSQNTAGQRYRKEEKQSGVFSGGGIGVTIGSRTLENEQTASAKSLELAKATRKVEHTLQSITVMTVKNS
jgi:hypothetical protein